MGAASGTTRRIQAAVSAYATNEARKMGSLLYLSRIVYTFGFTRVDLRILWGITFIQNLRLISLVSYARSKKAGQGGCCGEKRVGDHMLPNCRASLAR
jgi:hypothetical protein